MKIPIAVPSMRDSAARSVVSALFTTANCERGRAGLTQERNALCPKHHQRRGERSDVGCVCNTRLGAEVRTRKHPHSKGQPNSCPPVLMEAQSRAALKRIDDTTRLVETTGRDNAYSEPHDAKVAVHGSSHCAL
jgi:hypothetical protein